MSFLLASTDMKERTELVVFVGEPATVFPSESVQLSTGGMVGVLGDAVEVLYLTE